MENAANISPENTASRPTSSPHVDLRLVLYSIVGFWLFYFCFNTLHSLIDSHKNFWAMIPPRGFVSIAGGALLYVLYQFLRRLETRPMGQFVTAAFLAAVPVSLSYGALNYTAFSLAPISWDEPTNACSMYEKQSWLLEVVGTGLNWYFFIAAWAILYVALSYGARVRHVERSLAVYQAETRNAQLRALRYQINPHFLFNTLNSLSSLILREKGDEAERMVLNLAAFFRTSLTDDPCEDVTLGDEIRLQRLYLEIEQARFPERLRVMIDMPPFLA